MTLPILVYPWEPFPGAYLAPVPVEAAPSAMNIAAQIPETVMGFGNGIFPTAAGSTPGYDPDRGGAIAQVPEDVLALIPVADHPAYAELWPNLSAAQRQIVREQLAATKAYADQASDVPSAPIQAGLGTGALVLLAVAAFFLLRK